MMMSFRFSTVNDLILLLLLFRYVSASVLRLPKYVALALSFQVLIQMFATLDKAKPSIENIRGLNLAAVRPTTVQVTSCRHSIG
jgi:uncharacterized membrane protein YfhO